MQKLRSFRAWLSFRRIDFPPTPPATAGRRLEVPFIHNSRPEHVVTHFRGTTSQQANIYAMSQQKCHRYLLAGNEINMNKCQ